jgi:hypothetical protein
LLLSGLLRGDVPDVKFDIVLLINPYSPYKWWGSCKRGRSCKPVQLSKTLNVSPARWTLQIRIIISVATNVCREISPGPANYFGRNWYWIKAEIKEVGCRWVVSGTVMKRRLKIGTHCSSRNPPLNLKCRLIRDAHC